MIGVVVATKEAINVMAFLCIQFKAKIKRGWCKCPLLNDITPPLAGNLVVEDVAASRYVGTICIILSFSRTAAA